MPPESDQTPIDPEDRDYFSYNWADLTWSPWVPFTADKHTFHEIPRDPGLYRIRPAGKDFLMYIGETRRPLHQRLHNLRMELRNRDLMPWSDPHAEAPALWAWSDWSSGQEEEKRPQNSSSSGGSSDRAEKKLPQASSTSDGSSDMEEEKNLKDSSTSGGSPDQDDTSPPPGTYECSAAPLDASSASRRVMESYLLYRYRQERGESPLCNFGRFPPRYRKSTNRNEGKRGGRLETGQNDNPAGGPSHPPLCPKGKPGDPDWMGLGWSSPEPLVPETTKKAPEGPGLFLLADAGSREVLFIGQSGRCAGRLSELCGRSWDGRSMEFLFHAAEGTVLPHTLKEQENDLIGNFFELYRKAPEYQFRAGP